MARSFEQIMKDIETVKATPAFQKKMAALQKELDKKKKIETAKPKTKPKSPTTRATSRTPKIRGGAMRGGSLGSISGGGMNWDTK